MDRRAFLGSVGASATVPLAGCGDSADGADGDGDADDAPEAPAGEEEPASEPLEGRLLVATYTSMVGEGSAGEWIETAFAEAYPEVELDWVVPESRLEHYAKRLEYDAAIDADVALGVTVDDLVRLDERLGGDGRLFQTLERNRLERVGRVREDPSASFGDPRDRVLPVAAGTLGLVYDETVLEEPTGLEALRDPAYAGDLLLQDARTSNPGGAFFCWTLARFGTEGAIEYWEALLDGGATVRESWSPAYEAYLEGAGSAIVSYSTDRVASVAAGRPNTRHQVAIPDGRGIAAPEGVAIFEGSERTELAYRFMDFLLSRDAQRELATRNAQFPAVTEAFVDLPTRFTDHAIEPADPLALTHDDLHGGYLEALAAWEELLEDG